MSGGNQQKVIVARWARTCRRVLILDEPTRGVDVGAKQEIYRIIQELADAGIAILMISSELPEIVGLADRVVVMREGRDHRRTGRRRHQRGGDHAARGARGGGVSEATAASRFPGFPARRPRPVLVAVAALLVVLYVIGAVGQRPVQPPANLLNVYEQSTALALVSLGQTWSS